MESRLFLGRLSFRDVSRSDAGESGQKQKIYAVAFGITTDSNKYQFWFMGSDRQLLSSVLFEWRLAKAESIAWIDKMLAEAIEASPLTPSLRQKISLLN